MFSRPLTDTVLQASSRFGSSVVTVRSKDKVSVKTALLTFRC